MVPQSLAHGICGKKCLLSVLKQIQHDWWLTWLLFKVDEHSDLVKHSCLFGTNYFWGPFETIFSFKEPCERILERKCFGPKYLFILSKALQKKLVYPCVATSCVGSSISQLPRLPLSARLDSGLGKGLVGSFEKWCTTFQGCHKGSSGKKPSRKVKGEWQFLPSH